MAAQQLATDLVERLAACVTGAAEPPVSLVSLSLRILGSNLAAKAPLDGPRAIASIKAQLARNGGGGGTDGSGGSGGGSSDTNNAARAGVAAALRFEELRHQLQVLMGEASATFFHACPVRCGARGGVGRSHQRMSRRDRPRPSRLSPVHSGQPVKT